MFSQFPHPYFIFTVLWEFEELEDWNTRRRGKEIDNDCRLAIVKKEKRKKRNFSRVRRRPGLMYRLVLCKQMHIETIQRSKESVALLAPYVRTLPCATTR